MNIRAAIPSPGPAAPPAIWRGRCRFWGDSGVGHPLLDQPAFLERVPSESIAAVREHWLRQWRSAVPGSDPARASALLAPVAAARQAVIYRGFLDRIEPSEHPYHRADPAEWLRRTAALVR